MLYLIPLGLPPPKTERRTTTASDEKRKKRQNWCQNRGVDTFRVLYNQTSEPLGFGVYFPF